MLSSVNCAEEIRHADNARRLQHALNWPVSADIKVYANENWIRNSLITTQDVSHVDCIYGKPIPIFKSHIQDLKVFCGTHLLGMGGNG